MNHIASVTFYVNEYAPLSKPPCGDTIKLLGGEMASTGIKKLRLHTELLPARKNGGNVNIIADDYELALAA